MSANAPAQKFHGVPIKTLERWGKLLAVAADDQAADTERNTALGQLEKLAQEHDGIAPLFEHYSEILNRRLAKERREPGGSAPRSAQEERAKVEPPSAISPFEGVPYATAEVEKIDFGHGFFSGLKKAAALKLARGLDEQRKALEAEWNDLTPEEAIDRLAQWQNPKNIPKALRPLLEPFLGKSATKEREPRQTRPKTKGKAPPKRHKPKRVSAERERVRNRLQAKFEKQRADKLEYLEMAKLRELLKNDDVTNLAAEVDEDKDGDPVLVLTLEIAPQTWEKAKKDPEEFMRFLMEGAAEAEEELEDLEDDDDDEEDDDDSEELDPPDDDDEDEDSPSE